MDYFIRLYVRAQSNSDRLDHETTMLQTLGLYILNEHDTLCNSLEEIRRQLTAAVQVETTALAHVAAAVEERDSSKVELVGVVNLLNQLYQWFISSILALISVFDMITGVCVEGS